jgi:hypothetical protein
VKKERLSYNILSHAMKHGCITVYFSGPILEHYQECGQAVSSAWYCAMLVEELKPTVCNKCRALLTNRVVLHRDDVQPRMAAAAVDI